MTLTAIELDLSTARALHEAHILRARELRQQLRDEKALLKASARVVNRHNMRRTRLLTRSN